MANLLSTCTSESEISNTFPLKMQAGYVGFDVWRLKAGESITLPSDERGADLRVLVTGLWPALRAAISVFYPD